MKQPRPKMMTMTFNVNPYEGAARMVLGIAPEGYRFVSLVRQGTRAKVTYRRIKP